MYRAILFLYINLEIFLFSFFLIGVVSALLWLTYSLICATFRLMECVCFWTTIGKHCCLLSLSTVNCIPPLWIRFAVVCARRDLLFMGSRASVSNHHPFLKASHLQYLLAYYLFCLQEGKLQFATTFSFFTFIWFCFTIHHRKIKLKCFIGQVVGISMFFWY